MKDNGQSEVDTSAKQHRKSEIGLLDIGTWVTFSVSLAAVLLGDQTIATKAALLGIGGFAVGSYVFRKRLMLRGKLLALPHRWRIAGALIVVAIVTVIVVLGLMSSMIEAGKSNFYIVEFSENMDGNITSAVNAVPLITSHLDETDLSGLLIFGGNENQPTGCNTAVQRFVNPTERDNALNLMANFMNQLQLISTSRFVPLQEAILESLRATNDSSGRGRLQNLIVFTTGEPTCSALSSEAISQIAQQLGIRYFLILLVREGRPGDVPALQDFVRQQGTLEVFLKSDTGEALASRIDRILGLQPTVYPQFSIR